MGNEVLKSKSKECNDKGAPHNDINVQPYGIS